MSKRVTEQQFLLVKGGLFNKFAKPYRLAAKYDLSLKTIYQIRGSRTFAEYTQQNKAQHLPVKNSLRDELLEIHRLMFDEKDNKYIPPKSGSVAAVQIRAKLLQ